MSDLRLYPQGSGTLKSRYIDGVLHFYGVAGTEIYSIDPVSNVFTVASGATFKFGSDTYVPAASSTKLTPVAGKCTVSSEVVMGPFHQTVLALSLTGANDLDLANADHGTGVKIADFPAGRIYVAGAVMAGSCVTNDAFEANPNDIYYVSAGSVVGADDADLTGTEADLIPKTTLDSVGNTELTLAWAAFLAAPATFATGLDLYINAAVAGTSISKALTIAITGSLKVTWINLG